MVVVEHRDRLARFGVGYLEAALLAMPAVSSWLTPVRRLMSWYGS